MDLFSQKPSLLQDLNSTLLKLPEYPRKWFKQVKSGSFLEGTKVGRLVGLWVGLEVGPVVGFRLGE